MSSRRGFLMGAAALSAAVVTPETARALAVMQATADWALATADLEADVAPRPMRLVHGRVPAGLSGTLFRNGPGKFRRPGGSVTHWFDGDGMVRAFRISPSGATLSARFVDTRKRRTESAAGRMVVGGFAPGAPGVAIRGTLDANAANTSLRQVKSTR